MITDIILRSLDSEAHANIRTSGLNHLADTAEEQNPTILGETTSKDDMPSGIQQKRCHILVVDDEDRFRGSLTFKLKSLYGATVEEAETGSMALEKAEKLSEGRGFDLILMDISMPEMTGIEAYKEMRKRRVNARIILMSAYFTTENQQEAQALGVTLLNKPIDKDILRTIILECGGNETS